MPGRVAVQPARGFSRPVLGILYLSLTSVVAQSPEACAIWLVLRAARAQLVTSGYRLPLLKGPHLCRTRARVYRPWCARTQY